MPELVQENAQLLKRCLHNLSYSDNHLTRRA